MATFDDLRRDSDRMIAAAERRRAALTDEARVMVDTARAAGRTHLVGAEDARMTEIIRQRDEYDDELTALRSQRATLDEAMAAEAESDRLLARVDRSAPNVAKPPAYDRVARVGAQARTYRPDHDRRGAAFLGDVVSAARGDYQAQERLGRHQAEEQAERGAQLERAVGTGAFAGLVVPQYLTDMYAPATAALRPFADACNRHDLPEQGMTLNISRITTATGVALQASENTEVQETNADDTLLTVNVQTAAGQQTISRQAMERGTGTEDVILDDLFRRYASALDNTLINQSTTGLAAVATDTAYDDASPTGPELYPKIVSAGAGVETALLGVAPADLVVMHPRRWAWLQGQMVSTWPMISQPNIPAVAAGTNLATRYGGGFRGVLPNGMAVVTSANVITNGGTGTNEDEIYVVPSAECHLWEDPNAPVMIRAEQPSASSLGVLLVLYGHFAYTFGRYANGMGKITGTGLTPPA